MERKLLGYSGVTARDWHPIPCYPSLFVCEGTSSPSYVIVGSVLLIRVPNGKSFFGLILNKKKKRAMIARFFP